MLPRETLIPAGTTLRHRVSSMPSWQAPLTMQRAAMNEDSEPAHVAAWDVAIDHIPARVLAETVSERVFLLPDKTLDGIGLYRDDVAGLVKTLRHDDVDVDFAYSQETRRYLSEYGSVDLLAVIEVAVVNDLTAPIIQNIVKIVWARARSAMGGNDREGELEGARVMVKIAEIEHTPSGPVVRGIEATGPVKDLEQLLRAVLVESGSAPGALPDGDPDSDGERHA